MSTTDVPAALAGEAAETEVEAPGKSEWAATALSVLATAAAVLIASFLAVATGLS